MSEETQEESGELPQKPQRGGWKTFYRFPPPAPEPEEVKRYRAYLTRLSKWLAYDVVTEKTGFQISVMALRNALISEGELGVYLDDAWAKRVFSDRDLFEDSGGGFWKVIQLDPDEAPSEPTRWQGIRPGDDVLGIALHRAAFNIEVLDRPDWKSKWLSGPEWAAIHIQMVMILGWAQMRGVEKPLVPLQERAWLESAVDDHEQLQTTSLWLTRTRMHLEAYQRFQHAAKTGDLSKLLPDDLSVYRDNVIRSEERPHTPQDSARFTRGLLLERGILYGKKD